MLIANFESCKNEKRDFSLFCLAKFRVIILNSAILITMKAKYDSYRTNYVRSYSNNFNNHALNFSLSIEPQLLIAPEFR